MKKLLQVSLQKTGGGAIDSLEWSNAFCQNDFYHQVFISSGNELLKRWEDNDLRKVAQIDTYGSSFSDFLRHTLILKRPLLMMKKIFNFRPDIVLVTHYHPWIIFILLSRIFLRFKLFYAVHENPFLQKENNNSIFNFTEKIFFKLADCIIVHSSFMKKQLEVYSNKELKLVPLGSYPSLFPGFSRIEHKEFNLLFIGRIESYKGIDTLIEAVDRLVATGMRLKLTVAGRGNLGDNLKKKIQEINGNLLNYWIDNNEIKRLLSVADVLVLPYKAASQSGVISMGLACGIPMIGSDVGGIPEQIRDGFNGLIFKAGSVEDLSAKIVTAYDNNDLLKKFSENALSLSSGYFSWKQNVAQFLKSIDLK
ncbi:MAG: Glycogen synthase [Parcubacteria group bacterium ADurb.Bin326]|nr:MAG: Glycogen synthase [Parcubacteria group bacterium ADurb.Bin326]